MHKRSAQIIKLTAAIALAILAVCFLLLVSAHAFNGPSTNAGTGAGAIGVSGVNNVSFGTTTPNPNAKVLIVASSTADTGNYAFKVLDSSQNTLFVIRNDDSIAIATTSFGGGALTIQGNILSSGNFNGTVQANNISAVGQFGANSGGGTFSFPGNVGIGITNPGQMLNLNGTNPMAEYSNGASVMGYVGGTGAVGGYSNIASAGDMVARSDTGNFIVTARNAVGNILFASGGSDTEKMRITNSGNVGIGTTNPGYKLDINGQTRFMGSDGECVFRHQHFRCESACA